MFQQPVNELRWISVGEALPENKHYDSSELVLICVKVQYQKQPNQLIAYYDFRHGCWRTTWGKVDGEVTHWRELPAPPEDYA